MKIYNLLFIVLFFNTVCFSSDNNNLDPIKMLMRHNRSSRTGFTLCHPDGSAYQDAEVCYRASNGVVFSIGGLLCCKKHCIGCSQVNFLEPLPYSYLRVAIDFPNNIRVLPVEDVSFPAVGRFRKIEEERVARLSHLKLKEKEGPMPVLSLRYFYCLLGLKLQTSDSAQTSNDNSWVAHKVRRVTFADQRVVDPTA